MRARGALALVVALAAPQPAAGVVLYDRVQLVVALKGESPCCVIDGRSAAARTQHPVKGALAWSDTLQIEPTGAVVVIADRDAAALAIGRKIEHRFKARTVIAVKGGHDTWNAIVAASEGSGMPPTFVIPSNTCEQGKPLQTLRSQRR